MGDIRAALVTGASRGIGRAVATGLAEDGYRVIGVNYVSDRRAAERTAAEVRAHGATPVLLRADLSAQPAATAAALAERFAAAAADHGADGVTALVNNAGHNGAQALGEIDESTYGRVMDLNLAAPLFLIQALAPRFSHGGRVVNVSTGYTRVAAPTHVAYAASKAGLNAITLALAPTLGARGVTINAVMPGVIDTDINDDWLNEPGAREQAGALSVFGRVGRTDDVARLVRYLASDGARWTTGQVIDVTGGSAL